MQQYRRHFRRIERVPDPNALTIFWVTDLHLKNGVTSPSDSGAVSGSRWFYTSPSKLDQFVAAVNDAQPSLAVCTGDLVDSGPSFGMFTDRWGAIDGSVKTAVTIGNHDMTGNAYMDVVSALGYDDGDEIAGSYFNQAFTLTNGHVSVRIIVVDTNINSDGQHVVTNRGLLQPDALDWIDDEIGASNEDSVLLFMHHGPHTYHSYFDDNAAFALQALVAKYPSKRVSALFGHHHVRDITAYKNLSGFPGFLCPALTELDTSQYTIVHVNPGGELIFETVPVSYKP